MAFFSLEAIPVELFSGICLCLSSREITKLWIAGSSRLQTHIISQNVVRKFSHELLRPQDIYWPLLLQQLPNVEEFSILWGMSGFYRAIPLLTLQYLPPTLRTLRLSFPQGLHVFAQYLIAQKLSYPSYKLEESLPCLDSLHISVLNGLSFSSSLEDFAQVFFSLPPQLTDLSFNCCLPNPFKDEHRVSTPINRIFQPHINEDNWSSSDAKFPPHLTRLELSCNESVLEKLPITLEHLIISSSLLSHEMECLTRLALNLSTFHVNLLDSDLPYVLSLLPETITDLQLNGRFLSAPKTEPLSFLKFSYLRKLKITTSANQSWARLHPFLPADERIKLFPITLTHLELGVEILLDLSTVMRHLPDIRFLSCIKDLDSAASIRKSLPDDHKAENPTFEKSALEALSIASPLSNLILIQCFSASLTSLTACFEELPNEGGLDCLRLFSVLRSLHATTQGISHSNNQCLLEKIAWKVGVANDGSEIRSLHIFRFLPPSLVNLHIAVPYSASVETTLLFNFIEDPSEYCPSHGDLVEISHLFNSSLQGAQDGLYELKSDYKAHQSWNSLKNLCITYEIGSLRSFPLRPPRVSFHRGICPEILSLEIPQAKLHIATSLPHTLRHLALGQFETRLLDFYVPLLPHQSLTFLVLGEMSAPFDSLAHIISVSSIFALPKALTRTDLGDLQLRLDPTSELEKLEENYDSMVFSPSMMMTAVFNENTVKLQNFPKLTKRLSKILSVRRKWRKNIV